PSDFFYSENSGWNEACGWRLLPAWSFQLRTGGCSACRRQRHLCKEHGGNVGGRYGQHRHRCKRGNAEGRKPWDVCQPRDDHVAASPRRTCDHASCRVEQRACGEHLPLCCWPEDRPWLWLYLPDGCEHGGAVRGSHGDCG